MICLNNELVCQLYSPCHLENIKNSLENIRTMIYLLNQQYIFIWQNYLSVVVFLPLNQTQHLPRSVRVLLKHCSLDELHLWSVTFQALTISHQWSLIVVSVLMPLFSPLLAEVLETQIFLAELQQQSKRQLNTELVKHFSLWILHFREVILQWAVS